MLCFSLNLACFMPAPSRASTDFWLGYFCGVRSVAIQGHRTATLAFETGLVENYYENAGTN